MSQQQEGQNYQCYGSIVHLHIYTPSFSDLTIESARLVRNEWLKSGSETGRKRIAETMGAAAEALLAASMPTCASLNLTHLSR
jgi:hypothetical protein